MTYRGYQVTVPASWPVVDLAKDPTACVRFDRPAVYLGKSTAQPDCPADAVGRTVGLVLEPLSRQPRSSDGQLAQAVEAAGVLATAYYAPGRVDEARQVLSTGRTTSKATRLAQPRAAAATPSVVATGNLLGGFAFDTCDAPSQSAMDAWLSPKSGYKAVGIYVSGGLRRCAAQPNLTPEWVGTNAAKGWQFLLIDVGLQAPCSNLSSRMSTDPATARAQGRTAAANAVASAQALGFAQRSAIYSDIEAYTSTAACKAAVLSYLSGWTLELNTRGYVGGAYVGAASGGVDLASAYNNTAYTRPDNLWFARWNQVTNTTDDKYIPASMWTNRQRVHQYQGDHLETHGGVEIKIDSNAVNLTAPPAALTGFDATGAYSTAALKWTVPAGNQVIVRRNAGGTTPPPLPNVGTAVYTGTAASTTATGLANATSYAFRAWAKDSTGKIGPGVDTVLIGTGATVAASAPAISYGGAVTLYTRATRKDSGASLVGVPLSLYARAKNSSTWREVARVTSDGTGQASSVQKPTVSTVYAWGYNGSPDLLGSRSGNATIEVKPTITINLAAAIKLGTTTSVYGYLRPQHPGTTAYLQRLTGTSWPTVATTKLNTTGNYGFSIKPTARGTSYYRVVWLADADHATTVSSTKAVIVS
ncbi:DUF1906 domain-containing protein [Kribbella lupini]|uniref:Fibronectin type-III domain-containing protein n=1 Tax=Kribbella lupini TaxID=291602 RepID=A0ABP4M0J5_9ACTN